MASETTGRESDKFMLRLPDGMRDRLKAEAEANKRSMNAEIVARLEASFGVDAAEDGLPKEIAKQVTANVTSMIDSLRERYERICSAIEARADQQEVKNQILRMELDRLQRALSEAADPNDDPKGAK